MTDYASRLLRACCSDPRRGAREDRDEIPPPHSITSSATNVQVSVFQGSHVIIALDGGPVIRFGERPDASDRFVLGHS